MVSAEEHAARVEAWRAERVQRLRQPHGWLSLVGLFWLADGVSRVGSDPSNEIQLPSGPPRAGRLVVERGAVHAWSEPGGFLHEGRPVDGLRLVADEEADELGGGATALDLGSLRTIVIRRSGRLALRVWDAEAPLLKAFSGIDAFPVDLRWRLEARFEPTGAEIAVPDVIGLPTIERSPGDVVFGIDGVDHRLVALEGGPDGELWLVFGDATNGAETYSGGRFLYTEAPRAGKVVVDFNLAYNPPCVFTPYATCPLPPAGNRLAIRIEAGERMWSPQP